MDRPINVLIFLDQVVDVMTRSVHIPTIIVLVTCRPLADFMGSSFCPLFFATVIIGFGYRTLSNLGISIFRIIYVKGHSIIAGKRYMEWTICFILVVVIICGTFVLVGLYLMVTSPRAYLKEMCHGYNSEYLLILLEYTGAVSQTQVHKTLLVIGRLDAS